MCQLHVKFLAVHALSLLRKILCVANASRLPRQNLASDDQIGQCAFVVSKSNPWNPSTMVTVMCSRLGAEVSDLVQVGVGTFM